MSKDSCAKYYQKAKQRKTSKRCMKDIKIYPKKKKKKIENMVVSNTQFWSWHDHLKSRRYFLQVMQVELWTFARSC